MRMPDGWRIQGKEAEGCFLLIFSSCELILAAYIGLCCNWRVRVVAIETNELIVSVDNNENLSVYIQ